MGGSSSKAETDISPDQFITQQFSSNCDVSCTNIQNNEKVRLFGTTVNGNISFSQSCSTNAICLSNSNIDAMADSILKATQQAVASNPGYFKSEDTESDIYVNPKQDIMQSTMQTCSISSLNEMNNVSLLAVNSKLNGNISFDQQGSTVGQCMLGSTMSASDLLTAATDNTSAAGKKQGKGILQYLIIGIVIIVICVTLFTVAHFLFKGQSKGDAKKQNKIVAEAIIERGCPMGAKPMIDHKSHKPIINPETNRLLCDWPPAPAPQAPVNSDVIPELKPDVMSMEDYSKLFD